MANSHDAAQAGGGASALVVRGLVKHFGATAALDGLDLDVAVGEVHGLVGENGAGKSTALRILAGAERADAGRIELFGAPFAPRVPADALGAGLATIYQELVLAPHLTVAENIALVDLPRRGPFVDRRALRDVARTALRRLRCDDLDPDTRVGDLALARRQMVEIARALVQGSRLLVLDEPTSSLDRRSATTLIELVHELRAAGTTIVWVSHALEEVRAVCDRVSVLRDGLRVATFDQAECEPKRLVRSMGGRDPIVHRPLERNPARGSADVRVERIDGRGVPLELARGEIVGLAGLVGAGRTELLRALFGLDPVGPWRFHTNTSSARADATNATPRQRWRAGIGFLPEDRATQGLALQRPLDENLCLVRLERLTRGGWLSPRRLAARAREFVDRLGIRAADVTAPVGNLSGGNQQKVALARLLEADCDVLLLDEPTRGVDVGAKDEIHRIILELARGHSGAPRAVLIVSSYLPELLAVCDRIAVLRGGVLGEARAAAELDEHQLLLEATGTRGVI